MCLPEAIKLQEVLAHEICEHGSMGLDRFMSLVLGHPQYGYYTRQDPFGAKGDFTTAPEVSQLFGEMIGIWLVDMWMQMGKPSPFILLEAGPGRGTLMADILRVSKEFSAAAQIHLLEMSPVLREKQKQALAGYKVDWHDELSAVPSNVPIFFIANEFFDALPFCQYIHTGSNGWAERTVEWVNQDEGKFIFGQRSCGSFDPVSELGLSMLEGGRIFEISPDRSGFMAALSRRIKVQNGAGLILDYGHLKTGFGDTFQALYRHQYVNPLTHIGEADLTSHVDFEALCSAARQQDITIAGMTTQGDFLNALGISLRAAALARQASQKQRDDLQKALHRLTHSDEMGRLFKVLGIYHHAVQLTPAGF